MQDISFVDLILFFYWSIDHKKQKITKNGKIQFNTKKDGKKFLQLLYNLLKHTHFDLILISTKEIWFDYQYNVDVQFNLNYHLTRVYLIWSDLICNWYYEIVVMCCLIIEYCGIWIWNIKMFAVFHLYLYSNQICQPNDDHKNLMIKNEFISPNLSFFALYFLLTL